MSVRILTDSGCDFTREDAAKLGIEIVPVYVIYGDERLRDGIDIDRATFHRRSNAGEVAKTEPATVDDCQAAYARAVKAGDDVVLISLSSQISKSCENAKTAALAFPGKVFVVDSKAAGGYESLLAEFAVERASAGDSAEAIAKRIDPTALKGGAFFAVPDMQSMSRSGRLPKAIIALGSMLNVSLVLKMTETGAIGPAGQSRSFDKTCDIMVEALVRAIDRSPQARIAISHIEAPETAATLAQLLEAKLGYKPRHFMIHESTLTLAANMGKGAVGIFAIVP